MSWRLQDYGLWADPPEEPKLPPIHWPNDTAKRFFEKELLYVHHKIVALNDTFDPAPDSDDVMASLGLSCQSNCWRAVLNLTQEHFDTRPSQSVAITRLAERLRNITVDQWFRMIDNCELIMDIDIGEEIDPW